MDKKTIMTYANRIANELIGDRCAKLSYVLKQLHRISKETSIRLSYREIVIMIITDCTQYEAIIANKYNRKHCIADIMNLKKYATFFEYKGRYVEKSMGLLHVYAPHQNYTCVCIRDIDKIPLKYNIIDSFITDSYILADVEVSSVKHSTVNEPVYNCNIFKSEINKSIKNTTVYNSSEDL